MKLTNWLFSKPSESGSGRSLNHDDIAAIGIDENMRLWIKPRHQTFPYIYREAMEVHWDPNRDYLYSPPPREWSYLRWFQQIVAAAKEHGCFLHITAETAWENVPNDLMIELSEWSTKSR